MAIEENVKEFLDNALPGDGGGNILELYEYHSIGGHYDYLIYFKLKKLLK